MHNWCLLKMHEVWQLAGEGIGIDEDTVCYLCCLTKVGRGFEDKGLLVPTIFRCAMGEG